MNIEYRQISKPIAFHLRAITTNSCYCFTPCTFIPNFKRLYIYLLFAFYINGLFFSFSPSLSPISRLVSIEFAMFSILFLAKLLYIFFLSFIFLYSFKSKNQEKWKKKHHSMNSYRPTFYSNIFISFMIWNYGIMELRKSIIFISHGFLWFAIILFVRTSQKKNQILFSISTFVERKWDHQFCWCPDLDIPYMYIYVSINAH